MGLAYETWDHLSISKTSVVVILDQIVKPSGVLKSNEKAPSQTFLTHTAASFLRIIIIAQRFPTFRIQHGTSNNYTEIYKDKRKYSPRNVTRNLLKAQAMLECFIPPSRPSVSVSSPCTRPRLVFQPCRDLTQSEKAKLPRLMNCRGGTGEN